MRHALKKLSKDLGCGHGCDERWTVCSYFTRQGCSAGYESPQTCEPRRKARHWRSEIDRCFGREMKGQ